MTKKSIWVSVIFFICTMCIAVGNWGMAHNWSITFNMTDAFGLLVMVATNVMNWFNKNPMNQGETSVPTEQIALMQKEVSEVHSVTTGEVSNANMAKLKAMSQAKEETKP